MIKKFVFLVISVVIVCNQQLHSTVIWHTGNPPQDDPQRVIRMEKVSGWVDLPLDSCHLFSPGDRKMGGSVFSTTNPSSKPLQLTKDGKKMDYPGEHDMLLVQGNNYYVDNSKQYEPSTVCFYKDKYGHSQSKYRRAFEH